MLYYIISMDEIICLKVSSSYKNEVVSIIETLTSLESEAVIRIGLHGLHVIKNDCPLQSTDLCKIKDDYEKQISQINRDHVVAEDVLRRDREQYVYDKCKDMQDEFERYKSKLTSGFDQERQRLQIDHKNQIEFLNEQLKKYQDDYQHALENIQQLQETSANLAGKLSSIESVKDMEIQVKVAIALDDYKKHHQDSHRQELEYKLKLQEDKYVAIIEELKLQTERQQKEQCELQQKLNVVELDLIRAADAKIAIETTSEIVIRNRVNELLEEKRTQYNNYIEELKKSVDEYKTKCKDIELKYMQTDNIKLHTLQEELTHTKEKLNKSILDNEMSKVKALLETVELQQAQINEIMNKKQSSAFLGQEGEGYFRELIEDTFSDYDSFELINTTKIAHSGDFHLKFHDFTILTDTKNFYKGKVSSTDINKFHRDMSHNTGVKIGWLVCLQGYVGSYGKKPFVFEIREGKLLVYINNLKNVEAPKQLLEEVFYSCQFIYNTLIDVESTNQVLEKYKRYEKRVNDLAVRLIKQNKQINATINQLRNDLSENERLVNDIIHNDILNMRNDHTTTVDEWFQNVTETCEGSRIKSNTLYDLFIKMTDVTDISNDMFKQILKSVVPSEQLQLPKVEKSQYVIVGYKLKE